jgi:hypothetical protein
MKPKSSALVRTKTVHVDRCDRCGRVVSKDTLVLVSVKRGKIMNCSGCSPELVG